MGCRMSPQYTPLWHKVYLELIILRSGWCRSCETGCKLSFCKEISVYKCPLSVLGRRGYYSSWLPPITAPPTSQRQTNTQAFFSFIFTWRWFFKLASVSLGSCWFFPGYPLCVHRYVCENTSICFSSSDFYYRYLSQWRVKGKLFFPPLPCIRETTAHCRISFPTVLVVLSHAA